MFYFEVIQKIWNAVFAWQELRAVELIGTIVDWSNLHHGDYFNQTMADEPYLPLSFVGIVKGYKVIEGDVNSGMRMEKVAPQSGHTVRQFDGTCKEKLRSVRQLVFRTE